MTIKVYSLPNCSQCDLTVKVLKSKNIAFEKVDMSTDDNAFATAKSLGYSSAPVVIVDQDNHWSGFRPDKISAIA